MQRKLHKKEKESLTRLQDSQIVLGTESICIAAQRKLGAWHQIGELEAEKQTKTECKSSAEQKNAGDSSSSLQPHHHAAVAVLIEPLNDDLCKSNLLSGTSKRAISSEKTVCLGFSTGNSSAQLIINLIPFNFHHGLSKFNDHILGHATFVL